MKATNTAGKAVLDAQKIADALKEGTDKTLKGLLNETFNKILAEEKDEEEPVEDNSYEEEEVETTDGDEKKDSEEAPAEGGEAEGEEDGDGAGDADDEWSDFEQYKVGDNDYDFTGVEGDEILKVYNKLGDDDQIFVKRDEDEPNKFEVKDDETGAEFVIELDPDAIAGGAGEEPEGDEGFELELGDEDGDEDGLELDLGDEGDDEGDFELDLGDGEGGEGDDIEIDVNGEDDDEENPLNEEDLGYTETYQKPVFKKKFNMKEPADSSTTNDWDAGAPKGDERPWAGKGDGKPFKKNVNEELAEDGIDENGSGHAEEHSTKKTNIEIGQGEGGVKRHHSDHAEYQGLKPVGLEESMKKIVAAAKQVQAENKQYRNYINQIKKSLYEAAILNVNLGKLVDILVNETTTRDEKKSILERFNNVKTIAEGTTLYNTIKGELSESRKSSSPVVEKQFTAGDKSALNETTIYSNNASLNLMERMDNLFVRK